MQAAITSIAKANMCAGLCPANVDSMMMSLERNPANPKWVSGMPTPVIASVPAIIIQ